MSGKTAVVVGATGAVGRELIPLLVASGDYEKVIVLHHRPTPFGDMTLIEEHVIDFAALRDVDAGAVDAVFCCIGTTQKAAGSTEAFQRVDRDIPVTLAKWAAAHKAAVFCAVSSIGANARAGSVYLRTKGEMEEGIAAAALRTIYIFRPSLLQAERREVRPAERYGNLALGFIEPVMIGPLRKYRAVPTKTVARAMLACATAAEPGVHIVESDAILDLGLDLGAQSLP
jgi:uncharacterized protein YbjT (DUF2867 family)